MSLLGIYTPFLYDSVNNIAAHYVKKTRYYRRALRTVTMSYRDTHSVYITVCHVQQNFRIAYVLHSLKIYKDNFAFGFGQCYCLYN